MRLFPRDRDLSKPLERIELRVRASDFGLPVEEVEMRLDRFLARHMPWRSRSSVQALVKDGHVLVDASTPDQPEGTGEAAVERRPGRRLRHGSRVVIVIPEELRVPLAEGAAGVEPYAIGPFDELAVLYRDEACLAVDKPAMLAVHPSGRHLTDTLIQRVHRMLGAQDVRREGRPRLAHRLDRETSGVILVGLDPRSHSELMRQFVEREVEKEYLAVVQGEPEHPGGRIELPLGSARGSRIQLKMAVQMDGQEAVTEWRVVRRVRGYALVACRILTGRQHQIRVHMEAIGHPLVGDKLYGYDEGLFQKAADGTLTESDYRVLELPRQALHSHRLVFTSPATGQRAEAVSPLAADLREFLDRHDPVDPPTADRP
jgi:23S rRNA pseudouridine1911/1915/1917 synthase